MFDFMEKKDKEISELLDKYGIESILAHWVEEKTKDLDPQIQFVFNTNWANTLYLCEQVVKDIKEQGKTRSLIK